MKEIDHYKTLMERHLADSTNYQAQLFHAWRVIAQQNKGLKRLSRKIKRLQNQLVQLQPRCDNCNGTGTAPVMRNPIESDGNVVVFEDCEVCRPHQH